MKYVSVEPVSGSARSHVTTADRNERLSLCARSDGRVGGGLRFRFHAKQESGVSSSQQR